MKVLDVRMVDNDHLRIELDVGLIIMNKKDDESKKQVFEMISHATNKINLEEKDNERKV